MTVSEVLREAIETCGMNRADISRATGVNQSTLSRFVASGKGLRSENLDRLAEFLGLKLTGSGKAGKARRGK
jgi:hypothetical protein